MGLSPNEQYAEFLASKGRKLTIHASRVVDVVFQAYGTFDTGDIVAALRGEVSRATICRAIAGLVEADLLRRVRLNDTDVYIVAADPDPGG